MPEKAIFYALGIVFGPEGVLVSRKNSDNAWAFPISEHVAGKSPEYSIEESLKNEYGINARAISSFPRIISSYLNERGEQMLILPYHCSFVEGEISIKGKDAYEAKWISSRELRNLELAGHSKELVPNIEMMSESCMKYILKGDREAAKS